jgi:hypothetical protein
MIGVHPSVGYPTTTIRGIIAMAKEEGGWQLQEQVPLILSFLSQACPNFTK